MRFDALLIASFASASVFAQGFGNLFEKAPPHIEKALRARITHFYQAHVEGKFRVADQVVHEDSKDVFFGADKTRYKSFKITSISYEENFTRAKVVVEANMDFYFVGFGNMPVHRPISSLWRVDGGEWWWYVIPYDPKEGRDSPFGRMRETPDTAGQPAPDLEAGFKAAPKVEDLMRMVAADRSSVKLSSTEASEETVTILSRFPGAVKLQLEAPEFPGLSVKLDKTALEGGAKATLVIRYEPKNVAWKPDMEARLTVEPTGAVIPITISFALPPANKP